MIHDGLTLDFKRIPQCVLNLIGVEHVLAIDECLALMIDEMLQAPQYHDALRMHSKNLNEVITNAPTRDTFRFKLHTSLGRKRARGDNDHEKPVVGRLYGVKEAFFDQRGYKYWQAMVAQPRILKDTLYEFGEYLDLDQKKGHAKLMYEFGLRLKLPMDAYRRYLGDFDHIADAFIALYRDPTVHDADRQLTRDSIKELFNLTLYGGGIASWKHSMTEVNPHKPYKPTKALRDIPDVDFYCEFKSETDLVVNGIIEANPLLFEYVNKANPLASAFEKRSRTLSFLFQSIECIETAYALQFLVRHKLVAVNTSDWAHDGCTVKPLIDRASIERRMYDLNEYVREQTGFRECEFVVKPFKVTAEARQLIDTRRGMSDAAVDEYVARARAAFRERRWMLLTNPPAPLNDEDAALLAVDDNDRLQDKLANVMAIGFPGDSSGLVKERAYQRAIEICSQHMAQPLAGCYVFSERDKGTVIRAPGAGIVQTVAIQHGEDYIQQFYPAAQFKDVFNRLHMRWMYYEGEGMHQVRSEDACPFVDAFRTSPKFPVPQKIEWIPWTYRNGGNPLANNRNTMNDFFPYRFDKVATTWVPTLKHIGYLRFFLFHLYTLSGDDKEERMPVWAYLVRYYAHMIQRPAEVPGTSITTQSPQGVGKDQRDHILLNMLGEKKVLQTTKPDLILGKFNSSAYGKIMIVLNEASTADNNRDNEGTMKSSVTEGSMMLERKYQEAVRVNTAFRIFRNTNNHRSLNSASDDDRRNMMIRCSGEMIGNVTYFSLLAKLSVNEEFLITLMWYFQRISLRHFVPSKFPRTAYCKSMFMANRSPFPLWLRLVIYRINADFPGDVFSRPESEFNREDVLCVNEHTETYTVRSTSLNRYWDAYKVAESYDPKTKPCGAKQFKEEILRYGISYNEKIKGKTGYEINLNLVQKELDRMHPIPGEKPTMWTMATALAASGMAGDAEIAQYREQQRTAAEESNMVYQPLRFNFEDAVPREIRDAVRAIPANFSRGWRENLPPQPDEEDDDSDSEDDDAETTGYNDAATPNDDDDDDDTNDTDSPRRKRPRMDDDAPDL